MSTAAKVPRSGGAVNLEQRAKRMCHIHKLDGLLAYAVAHGDEAEASRIRAELQKLISGL